METVALSVPRTYSGDLITRSTATTRNLDYPWYSDKIRMSVEETTVSES